jgi:3-oxoadipate enol-lactonase
MPFVDLGELRTHYMLTGEEGLPVLMFSNSLGTNLSMWDRQAGELQNRFRVLRYDTRGHGQSSVTSGDYTIEQLGRDAVALLNSLGIARVHFCGLSMGGMIGMWLGVHAAERIQHLVLCNTAARIGTKEGWNARIEKVRAEGMKPVAAAVVERWFTAEYLAKAPDQVAHARKMLEDSWPAGYAACCAAIRDMDQRDEIGAIKVPTLVIYGDSDSVIPVSEAEFVADRISGAERLALHTAHLSNIEQPAAFTSALNKFLK